MLRLGLFDIDGTLIGVDGAGRRALDRALQDRLGIPQALKDIRLDGMTDPGILHRVFMSHRQAPPEHGEIAAIFSTYAEYLAGEVARSAYHVKPGVNETLDFLETRGILLGLATGNLEVTARIKLERGDLWRRFPFGGFGSDAHERADLVRIALKRAAERGAGSLGRDEAAVIGDTPNDIAAAHAAGIRAIGVATGSYSVDDLRAAGADEAYATLSDWIPTLRHSPSGL
jgi:phosphoglycolate phosphatase-like HAD superfamily hydrolase